MRALICDETGLTPRVALRETESPRPGDGQVLIDVTSCAVNYPDVLMLAGTYQVKPPVPFIPGSEVSGVVSSLGSGVTGFAAGDRIIAPVQTGGMAEQVAVDARLVVPIPNQVDMDKASAVLYAYGTAYHALRDRAQLQAGESLLILGAAGGVGLAAVQLGRALGARVFAAASDAAKLDLCTANGAHASINYTTQDLRQAVRELTDSKGVDVVLDPVGGHLTEPAFRSTAWGGRYLVVGFAAGEIGRLPLNLPLLRGSSLVGVFWGSFVERDTAGHQRLSRDLVAMLERGEIRPVVSDRFGLDDAMLAIRCLAERRARGKVVVRVAG